MTRAVCRPMAWLSQYCPVRAPAFTTCMQNGKTGFFLRMPDGSAPRVTASTRSRLHFGYLREEGFIRVGGWRKNVPLMNHPRAVGVSLRPSTGNPSSRPRGEP